MKDCTIFIVLENTVSNLMASSRLIKRYDLNRLKVEIELTPMKPTLSELTHYYRLNRLIQVINENYHFYEHLINQLKWFHTIIDDERDKMKFILESILNYRNPNSNGIPIIYYIFKISYIMVEICESRKSHISNTIANRIVVEYDNNNKNNLMHSNIDLEIFISELHVLMDYFIEYLCYFIMNLRKKISENENFIRSFTSTSLTMLTKSSNASSSSSSRLTCSVMTLSSISKLIDDLIDIESHMPMKYNEQYTEAKKRLSTMINFTSL
ncbi:unnamed protein product [Schistosoma rodhaini]|uniref:Uncharacterized protein n=1 Tax=Schistosoma rodhaini TaxID=6188 RepID=A0AA85ESA4_9TREM|nr:unnamed protein product [Schistosoma rodhaini]